MEIITALPPNFAAIDAVFGISKQRTQGVIFAYGDRMYNPQGVRLEPQIIIHEQAHGREQLAMGVEPWWDRYLTNPQFRLEQEIIGHKAEWRAFCDRGMTRNLKKNYLDFMAARLSGPIYGNMLTIEQAKFEIKGGPGDW